MVVPPRRRRPSPCAPGPRRPAYARRSDGASSIWAAGTGPLRGAACSPRWGRRRRGRWYHRGTPTVGSLITTIARSPVTRAGPSRTGALMPIRILIVDDHAVVRQGLRMFLGLDPELEVVGEAADGSEAIRKARELKPDVVLMDLLMPVMDGITAIGVLRREVPDTEVLALTSVLEDASV